MASNILKPNDAPRRANVPRPAPVPETAPLDEAAAASAAAAAALAAEAPRKAPKVSKPPKDAPEAAETAAPRSGWSLFSLLDRFTSMEGMFREGLPVHYLPKMLFVMLLTLLYIGNTHYGNRMSRNIQRLKRETEDLRADYTTLKSDYMEASKQSEVARKVAALGMVESSSPPFRITVPAGHLEASALELLPVLTADTLAARVARDSAAAHLADSLAGRRRYRYDSADGGPEIIAPPQPLDDDSLAAGRAAVARPTRPAKPSATAKTRKRSAIPKLTNSHSGHKTANALTNKSRLTNKPQPASRNSVQKSTKQHKEKAAAHGSASKPSTR